MNLPHAQEAGLSSSVLFGAGSEVMAELARATTKFPQWPTDPLHAFAVVGEEFGECQKEVLQLCYEPHKSSKEALRKEAVQLAAMSLRFLASFDKYEFKEGPQHAQPNTHIANPSDDKPGEYPACSLTQGNSR